MSLLDVRSLTVEYCGALGNRVAVDGMSFQIGKGEFIGLAGESGSGKSTVAKAVMRILQTPGFISGGEVYFEGVDILKMSSEELRELRWRDMAMVFQSALDSLNPVLSIRSQFQDMAQAKLGRPMTDSELVEVLDFVQLEPRLLDSYPHQLSGGMRQRVGIALALSLKPKLLILDEPTTALDVVVQRHILRGLIRLRKQLGFAVLFITHDLPVLLAMSDRVIVMKDGQVCDDLSPAELRHHPTHPYTRTLLDSMALLVADDSRTSGRGD